MGESRWKFRFQHLQRAYYSLLESIEARKKEPENLFIRDSLIQRYEYTIELAWKTFKDYLYEEGFQEASSPKEVIRKAFAEGYISQGESWLEAITDRNSTSHAYDESIANKVVRDVEERYLEALAEGISFLEQRSHD